VRGSLTTYGDDSCTVISVDNPNQRDYNVSHIRPDFELNTTGKLGASSLPIDEDDTQ